MTSKYVTKALAFIILVAVGRAESDHVKQDGNAELIPGYMYDMLKNEVSSLKRQLGDIVSFVSRLENGLVHRDVSVTNASTGSSVYTRWGRTVCPSESVSLYSGYMGGSLNTDDGSAYDVLCLTPEPQFANFTNGTDTIRGAIYGMEYQGGVDAIFDPSNLRGASFADQNVPCVSCHLENRASVMMLPAKRTCPDGWNLEYWGYLMAAVQIASGSHPFICVDYQPEVISGGENPEPAGYIYNVHARCGAITCPNFVEGWELTCAVCSR